MSQVYTSSTIPLSFDPQHEGHLQWQHIPPSSSGNAPPESESFVDNASPIINCMLAGGFGGVVGDSTMHSLDTVKTRQQGFLYQLKYRSMIPAYLTIFKEEGFLEVCMEDILQLYLDLFLLRPHSSGPTNIQKENLSMNSILMKLYRILYLVSWVI